MLGFVLLVLVIAILFAYIVRENKNIVTTGYIVKSDKIDRNLNIVHLSDVHNTDYGDGLEPILSIVRNSGPDIILMTGDLIDRRRPDPDLAVELMTKLVEIAPVYFVLGNHEAIYKGYYQLEERMIDAGVNVIRNSRILLTKNIEIIGIDDPHVASYKNKLIWDTFIDQQLENLAIDDERYTILLSHMPQYFEKYTDYNIDLTLCGHAHGGQIILPGIGALFAPEQGLFPKYTQGRHTRNGRHMIVSRGVGRSRFPLRVNNNPEIIEITLLKEEKKNAR